MDKVRILNLELYLKSHCIYKDNTIIIIKSFLLGDKHY